MSGLIHNAGNATSRRPWGPPSATAREDVVNTWGDSRVLQATQGLATATLINLSFWEPQSLYITANLPTGFRAVFRLSISCPNAALVQRQIVTVPLIALCSHVELAVEVIGGTGSAEFQALAILLRR